MFLELFLVGGLLWWALIITMSILIVWSLETENGAFATTTVVVGLLLWQFFGDLEIQRIDIATIWTHVLYFALGYIICGAIWGVIKWNFFVGDRKEEYEEYKRNWLENHGVYNTNVVPDKLKNEFKNNLIRSSKWSIYKGGTTIPNVVPLAQDNKARIVRWMAYWPWSILWSMLADVCRHIFRWVQSQLASMMNYIAYWRFGNVEDDFTVVEVEKKETEL